MTPPFQRLADAHAPALRRFLAGHVGAGEADDVLQETLLAALVAYPPAHAQNLRGWLFTIAHRKALDAHRARARRPVAVAALPDGPDAGARGMQDGPDDELWALVAALPERQRGAVLLRFVGDLAHREIAAVLETTEGAARRALSDGLSKLREEYHPT